ncbi:helix-turn-helix domain-containing protein [Sphingomonas lenta]|uniref:helix-turn-helix domain-containing protein n=1 Tax=Sphingomonas lenta TaxID=1141887 RepID=UPI00159584A2|nr:helix-turn-helix domain-containing protein [Sphingomonas lenta]
MATKRSVGERLKAVRKRAGLAQGAFAQALGCSRQSIVNWEGGSAAPPIAILAELRRKFDVDPEWVVMGEDDTPRSRYGPADWDAFDGLVADVEAVCRDVGLKHQPERHVALARDLYDAGLDPGATNRKHLRATLLKMSMRK